MNLLREKLRAKGCARLLCSEAPDLSGANAAALKQAQLSQEQLDWVKSVYEETAPDRAAAQARANAVSDQQMESARLQDQLTRDYNQYQTSTFRPVEQKIASESLTYNTPERREAAAGQAMADVDSQVAAAREQIATEQAARGVDPSSGNAAFIAARMGIGAAAAKAAAGNEARQKVETIGSAKLADAANLGRNIASAQGTTASLALNAGNSSVQNAGAAMNAGTAGVGMVQQGYAGAQAGLAGAGQTYLGIANAQQKAGDNSALMGAVGTVAGGMMGGPIGAAIGSKISDRSKKTNIRALDPEGALEAVLDTPAYTYEYKPGTQADDGGQPHAGGMAQDMKRTMGPIVSDGKRVNVAAEQGFLIAGMKALDKKVSRIAAAAGVDV